MMVNNRLILGSVLALLVILPAVAQTLVLSAARDSGPAMEAEEPTNSQPQTTPTSGHTTTTGAMPSRGMTMQQVEQRLGPPVARRAAVGNPPITRWEYEGFIVYFEHRHVIHSVAKITR